VTSAEDRARRDREIAERLAAGERPEAIVRTYREVRRLTARQVRRIGARVAPRADRDADDE